MDLRDRFAAHFASALVDAFADADHIAWRAYDLAEAMLAERARRIDADEEGAISVEPRRASIAPPVEAPAFEPHWHHGALLDEPEPVFEPDLVRDDEEYEYEEDEHEDLDPSLLEPPYDPRWDLETHLAPTPDREASRPPGPGLARTLPGEVEERKDRTG